MTPWTPGERRLLGRLTSPIKIQNYLNSIAYDPALGTSSPRWVIKERKANCFEGALFAAAALRTIGYPPCVVDMLAHNDDDHVIAVFKQNGAWGAVAKSNFTVLRFREPVYRSIRELVMSYFDVFYNTLGEKTLRAYSFPFNLARFDRMNWMTTDEDLEEIGDALDRARHIQLLSPKMIRSLQLMDRDLMRGGLLGAKKAGLFKPKWSKKI
jgi:hypothetical protein